MRGLEAGVLGTVSQLCGYTEARTGGEHSQRPASAALQANGGQTGDIVFEYGSQHVYLHTPQAPPPREQSLTRGRILVDLRGLWDLETLWKRTAS